MFSPRFHGSFRVAGTGTFNSYIHAIYDIYHSLDSIAKMTFIGKSHSMNPFNDSSHFTFPRMLGHSRDIT